MKKALQPKEDWGPADPKYLSQYKYSSNYAPTYTDETFKPMITVTNGTDVKTDCCKTMLPANGTEKQALAEQPV